MKISEVHSTCNGNAFDTNFAHHLKLTDPLHQGAAAVAGLSVYIMFINVRAPGPIPFMLFQVRLVVMICMWTRFLFVA